MKKLSGSKLPVEVKGHMSPEGADRVGLLMTITMLVERLWWKIAIVISLSGLVFNSAHTNKLITRLANINELTQGQAAYACLVVYQQHTQSFKFKCSGAMSIATDAQPEGWNAAKN